MVVRQRIVVPSSFELHLLMVSEPMRARFLAHFKNLLSLLLLTTLTGLATAADNVVMITFDGLRWQELFRGLDLELAKHEQFSEQSDRLMENYWSDDPDSRAEKIFPFLHGTVISQGTVIGNRDKGSCAQVSNPWYFSYPGYSEILTGVVNVAINSNGKIWNPEKTIHELLNSNPEFTGRSAAFGSWDVFPYIFNVQRSGVFVNAFEPLENPVGEVEVLLNQLHREIPPPWPTVRNDAFTHNFALSYLRREQPRLLFISYGETDDFAHDAKYDEYIFAAERTDAFVKDVWETLQAIDHYRDNTVLFISVDHGRGEEPIETWLHHASMRSLDGYMSSLARYEQGIVGSDATWMAAMGPGIANNGSLATDECLTSDRIASTLMQVLGEDYRDYNEDMGTPIQQFFE